MSVNGTFEVELTPQKDDIAPAGRMLISKKYTGSMQGVGSGQMISKRTDNGVAIYSAIEEFDGLVEGAVGTFTLVHNGYMSSEKQMLDIKILDGSGTGDLKNISGAMKITQDDGGHQYELTYSLGL